MNTCPILPLLQETFDGLDIESLSESRKATLEPLISYLSRKLDAAESIQLHFICTHNSRRSQLAQCWTQVASHYYKLPVDAFSGGVEVTSCHPNTIEALRTQGFKVHSEGIKNPKYHLTYARDTEPVILFSKLYNDEENPEDDFTAIMTCGHANENCPIIPGADVRIPITYSDPKVADGQPNQAAVYLQKSLEIALEMKYVFATVSSNDQP